jgi:cyclase
MDGFVMEKVTENVFAETKLRGCNPGYVVTSDGVVVIDTPQLPTYALEMKKLAEKNGSIKYIINTEHHVDHIFGNYYFRDTGIVISHIDVYNNFMKVTPKLNPYEYAKEAIPTDDPGGESIFPDEESYFADPNKPTITFEGNMTIRLGGHTFELISTPGHTPGQIAVHIPEERVAFVGDTVFNKCQTWHMESDIDTWIESLDFLKTLDVDYIVPGHGTICTKHEIDVQKAFLYEWLATVSVAIAKGWSKEECVEKISFLERFPVDIGQEYMGEFVNTNNVSTLYDKLKNG